MPGLQERWFLAAALALMPAAMPPAPAAVDAESTRPLVLTSVVRCEGAIGTVWPAPVGHCQPRQWDIPAGFGPSLSPAGQDALDPDIGPQLKICRGC